MIIALGSHQAHQGQGSRAFGITLFLAAIFLAVLIQPVAAGKPEYLQLNLSVGQALEIEGTWNSSGGFVAKNIETLPQPRRPKLRGAIQQINVEDKTITMYGCSMSVNDETEFIESGETFAFDSLKTGMRIEVTCKFDTSGIWQARKITARGVKASDKIKGTISRAAIDGIPPDTIEISTDRALDEIPGTVKIQGIIILLMQETDVMGAMLFESWVGEEEFGDLNITGDSGLTKGIMLNDKFVISGEVRVNVRDEREFDLSTVLQYDRDEAEPDVRLQLYGFLEQNVSAFSELRLKKRFLISSEQNNLDSGPYELELIQLYFLASDIGGKKVALQIGRMDFDEPREWLFDDYLDAIRLSYYGMKPLMFEAAYIYGGESYKPEFRTWKDFFGSVHWYFDQKSSASAYFMTRSDTDVQRKREPTWWGLRYYGRIKDVIRPWADAAIMRGEDKHKTLKGWAIDLGATFLAKNLFFQPSATFGYAVGSGDSTNSDQTDHRFRQTVYEDNVDKLGGATSLNYYGAVLDPELSNIKITTLGIGFRPRVGSSVELLYHRYRQHYAVDGEIRGSNIETLIPANNTSTDIGWGMDVVIGIPKLFEHIKSRLTLGWFNPGKAFEPLYTEMAILSRIDIKVGF